MEITTNHPLAAAIQGGPAILAALTFTGSWAAGQALAWPGSPVRYTVTDGAHVVRGADIFAPMGWRASANDILRSVCSFLAHEVEHAGAHDRGLWGAPCPEYGVHCPALDEDRISILAQMVDTLDMFACSSDEFD